jgi:hypothetical protein
MKAPKGRNVIAWGIATGKEASLFIEALKGRNIYVALSGLNEITKCCSCGDATGYHIAPLRGFFKLLRRIAPALAR